jgi:hypothetical protein
MKISIVSLDFGDSELNSGKERSYYTHTLIKRTRATFSITARLVGCMVAMTLLPALGVLRLVTSIGLDHAFPRADHV